MDIVMVYNKDRLQDLLRQIFDDTDLLTRKEWAKVLSVTEVDIEKWVSGEDLPKAETFRMFWQMVLERDIPKEILDEMNELAECRFEEISRLDPNTKLNLVFDHFNSLGSYVTSPRVKGFLRRLSFLPGEKQERLLDEAIDLFDKYKRE